tara:strand:+ start:12551 stop:12868 length:318 start_codon:yes stop_codon:yes gene_type:complete
MAITINPRPTVFGDRLVITGSYEAGDTEIDLSSQLASIDAVMVNPSTPNSLSIQDADPAGGSSFGVTALIANDVAGFSGTTITITAPALGQTTKAGTFLAIGRRS